jgi:hypothetical protein
MDNAIVQNLSDARQLRNLLEKELGQEQDVNSKEFLMLMLLDNYVRDLEFQLGQTSPYADDLQRRIFLKQICKLADRILDSMQEHFVGDVLPEHLQNWNWYMFSVVFPVVSQIQAIEAEYPEQAEHFAFERAQYAQSLDEVEHVG